MTKELEKAITKRKRGRPRTLDPKVSKGAKSGLKQGYTRRTMIFRDDHIKELKLLASEANLPVKNALEVIMETIFSSDALRRKVLQSGFKKDEFLTVDEIADALDLTPTTVRHYITIGMIPAKKVGKEWIVERTADTRDKIVTFCWQKDPDEAFLNVPQKLMDLFPKGLVKNKTAK